MKLSVSKVLPLCAAIAATVASAQDNADNDLSALALEEIIVTATRRETSLQETSVSVTAVSAEAIQDRNIVDLRDVAKYSPGISLSTRPGRGTAASGVAIRGIGVDSFDSGPAVGIYVDEVYNPSIGANILSLMDVERVEILRGPQGTSFGRNTISGAIQYVTKAPDTEEFEASLRATAGNFSRNDIMGAVNIPFAEDFAVRLSAMRNDRDGYVKDLLNDIDRGADETEAGRIRFRWEPSDELTLDLKYEKVKQDSNGKAVEITAINPGAVFPGITLLNGLFDPSLFLTPAVISTEEFTNPGFDGDDFFKYDFDVFQTTINYDINDNLSVKYIFADASWESDLYQDFDGTPIPLLQNNSFDNSYTDLTTHELQFQGSAFDDRLNYTVGYYYTEKESLSEWQAAIRIGPELPAISIPAGPTLPPNTLRPNFGQPLQTVEAQAIYLNTVFDLTDQLALTLGGRYTEDELSSELVLPFLDVNPTSPTVGQIVGLADPVVSEFDNSSFALGLDYDITDEIMVYGKISEGFRAGGFNANWAVDNGGSVFDPEEATTLEFGMRADLLDGRLRLNPTIFFTEWDDIQVNVPVTTPSGPAVLTDNAGDAEVMGLELEFQYVATDSLQIFGSLAWLDTEYTRIDPTVVATIYPSGFLNLTTTPPSVNPPTFVPALTLDSPLALAPEYKITVGAQYDFTIGDIPSAFIFDYAWTDDHRSNPFDLDHVLIESYGLLNARLRIDVDDNLTIALFGTNLTDERYLLGGTDFARSYTVGVKSEIPGRPREYGLEVSLNF
jgi:iron complex outermembrane receptor protein